MKEKVISVVSVLLGIAAALIVASSIDPVVWLRAGEEPVMQADIDKAYEVLGDKAGEDIPRINTVEEFEDCYEYSCVTIEPLSIKPTGVYHLKNWVSRYSTARRGGKRAKALVKVSKLNIQMLDYNQFYLLELPDHNYIVAEIPEYLADAISRGESVTLPIGGRVSMTNSETLLDICDEYNASTAGVFYAMDDEWYESNDFMIAAIRIIPAGIVFLIVGVLGITIGNKVFKVKEEK